MKFARTIAGIGVCVMSCFFSSPTFAGTRDVGDNPSGTSLTKVEQEAARWVQTIRFAVEAAKKCEGLKAAENQQLVVPTRKVRDARGRVSMVQLSDGSDMVLEYSTDAELHPIAVTLRGNRVSLSGAAAAHKEAATLKAMVRARMIVYRAVHAICGMGTGSRTSLNTLDPGIGSNFYLEEGPEYNWPPTGLSEEWFSVGFWSDHWRPDYTSDVGEWYNDINAQLLDQQQCLTSCTRVCSRTSEVTGVACSMIAPLLATGPYALAIGGACALGSLVGKYICEDSICITKCQ